MECGGRVRGHQGERRHRFAWLDSQGLTILREVGVECTPRKTRSGQLWCGLVEWGGKRTDIGPILSTINHEPSTIQAYSAGNFYRQASQNVENFKFRCDLVRFGAIWCCPSALSRELSRGPSACSAYSAGNSCFRVSDFGPSEFGLGHWRCLDGYYPLSTIHYQPPLPAGARAKTRCQIVPKSAKSCHPRALNHSRLSRWGL